jgi:integral membrane protein (TIGR01906 family)
MNLRSLFSWLVAVTVLVTLVLSAVRIVLSPWYLEFEYRTPNFPSDRYGFTLEERLQYSRLALAYLLNDADISFLGDLRFPAGQVVPEPSCQFMEDCSYLYNPRELKHMVDVKIVVQAALRVWYGSLVLLAILGLFAWRGGIGGDYRRGLARGGWLTIYFIAAIIIFVLAAFGVAFVLFHQIFFEAGTWTFYFSDTLIRLFPERFWRDTFLVVGLIAAGLALLLALGFREGKRERGAGLSSDSF